MHDERRIGNLLGATALALTDLAVSDATAAAGTSTSGAAALVVLSHAPGLSVTELGRRVGLSQPAAARMVDALEQQGLVRREPTLGRWVAVRPTRKGRTAAARLLSARGGQLVDVLGRLTTAELASLEVLLGKLLDAVYDAVPNAERLCRLCDRRACVADGAVCPVGNAERQRGADRRG